MAEILNKARLFMFLSFFQLLLNIGCFLTSCVVNNKIDIITLFGSIPGAFIPLTSLIPLVTSGFALEAIALLGVFTGIISALQLYILAEIILAHVPFVDV